MEEGERRPPTIVGVRRSRAPARPLRALLFPTPRGAAREDIGLDALELHGISRSFDFTDRRLVALDGVDLRVAEREVVAIVGPNGCGKSTLLRIMSGLLAPDGGVVTAFGEPVVDVHPRIGLVFQEPRLLPWRTVLDNVALPLELAGVPRAEREEQARAILELTDLREFAGAMPHQLSGGLAQRASLARALAPRPDVLLLDEPFSALDAMTRERLDAELLQLWGRTGTTIVLVTHSIAEAVYLADRVLVMSPRPGRIVAEVEVTAARPRRLGGDAAVFSQAAEAVRELLARATLEVDAADAADGKPGRAAA